MHHELEKTLAQIEATFRKAAAEGQCGDNWNRDRSMIHVLKCELEKTYKEIDRLNMQLDSSVRTSLEMESDGTVVRYFTSTDLACDFDAQTVGHVIECGGDITRAEQESYDEMVSAWKGANRTGMEQLIANEAAFGRRSA